MSETATGITEGRSICFNCKHWSGDKERVLRVLESAAEREAQERALDPRGGWVPSGECGELFVQGYITGHDFRFEPDAGFGCSLFEARP